MEATLAALDANHPDVAKHLRAEASVREELVQLRAQVEQYQKTFGSELSADSRVLVDRLRSSEKTIEQLRLQQHQESAVGLSPLSIPYQY